MDGRRLRTAIGAAIGRPRGPMLARWTVAALLALAALAILVNTLVWTHRLWSPMPFWDQWDTVGDYAAYKLHGPDWSVLMRQHMEHRLVFPRLLFLADFELFGGRNVLLIALVAAIWGAGAVALLASNRIERGDDRPPALAAGATATVLMASLIQSENLHWGFQVQFVGVYACAIGAYLLIHRAARRRAAAKPWGLSLAGAILLLGVGVFTMANGVVGAWLALVLAVLSGLGLRGLIALAASVAAFTAMFFFGYHAGPSGTVLGMFGQPVLAGQFVLSYLGNIGWQVWLGDHRHLICLALGGLGVALTAVEALRILLGRDRGSVRLVYVALILLVSAAAVLTAGGRMSFGVDQAFASRYMTPVALYWSCHLLYWRSVTRAGGWPAAPVWAACVVAALAMVAAQRNVKPELFEQIAAIDLAGDALLTGAQDPYALERAYPRPNVIAANAPFLRARGLSIFAEPEMRWIGQPLAAVAPVAPAADCLGAFDTAERLHQGRGEGVQVSGWAFDRRARRAADRVLIVGPAGRVAGLATLATPRADVLAAVPAVKTLTSGWRGYARATQGKALRAYVILANGAACPVGQPLAAPPIDTAVLEPYAGPPAAPLRAAVETENSFGPAQGRFAVAAPAPAGAYASWMGDDTGTGGVRFGPFRSQSGRIAFALVSGPDPSGGVVDVLDARDQSVLSSFVAPALPRWTPMTIPVEPGRDVILRARDQGGGWGQWIGIGPPQEVAAATAP